MQWSTYIGLIQGPEVRLHEGQVARVASHHSALLVRHLHCPSYYLQLSRHACMVLPAVLQKQAAAVSASCTQRAPVSCCCFMPPAASQAVTLHAMAFVPFRVTAACGVSNHNTYVVCTGQLWGACQPVASGCVALRRLFRPPQILWGLHVEGFSEWPQAACYGTPRQGTRMLYLLLGAQRKGVFRASLMPVGSELL
jgi:hypothetical protein